MGWMADLLKEIPSAARYKAELEEMERENTQLKQKVLCLESENKNLRQEIQRRDDIIQQEKSHNTPLNEAKINILKLLFKKDKLLDEQIAKNLGYEIQTTKFHLKELKTNNMVSLVPPSGRAKLPIWKWSLDQDGRRYLIENKIIS